LLSLLRSPPLPPPPPPPPSGSERGFCQSVWRRRYWVVVNKIVICFANAHVRGGAGGGKRQDWGGSRSKTNLDGSCTLSLTNLGADLENFSFRFRHRCSVCIFRVCGLGLKGNSSPLPSRPSEIGLTDWTLLPHVSHPNFVLMFSIVWTGTHLITEVEQRWARLLLGGVTRESTPGAVAKCSRILWPGSA
jgi:hypothetical protein